MKKLILCFLMAVGITTSSISQNIYPKRILWENDTVLAITKSQLIIINRTINDAVHLESINKTLQVELLVKESTDEYHKKISLAKDSIISALDNKFFLANNRCKSLENIIKANKRKDTKTTLQVGVVALSIGAILGLLIK